MLILLLFCQLIEPLTNDQIQAELRTAAQKRDAVLEAAGSLLTGAIDDAVKTAAVENRLEDVKALVLAKDDFVKRQIVPQPKGIENALSSYFELRRKAASDLAASYRRAIAYSETNQAKVETARYTVEMNRFIESEKRILSGRPAAIVAPTVTEKTTKERVEEFFLAYAKAVEDIESKGTTAKCEEATAEHGKILDDRLKSQTWVLRFRIDDLTPRSSSDTFLAAFSDSEEIKSVPNSWNVCSQADIPLSRQEALKVEPGDILVVTGTPRFSWDANRRARAITYGSLRTKSQYLQPGIVIIGAKFKVEPSSKN